MSERRQRPIAITTRQRTQLDERKLRYEKATGTEGEGWGRFLDNVTLFGLAQVGVYQMARLVTCNNKTATGACPCGKEFLIIMTPEVGEVVQIPCPECHAELVMPLIPMMVPFG